MNWLTHWRRTVKHPEVVAQYLSAIGMDGLFHILILMCKFVVNKWFAFKSSNKAVSFLIHICFLFFITLVSLEWCQPPKKWTIPLECYYR